MYASWLYFTADQARAGTCCQAVSQADLILEAAAGLVNMF
jgi:hypothetical protein